ncbi:DUF2057 family protein [Motilimonas cestriensis]|uniref:UPF0319 protein K6Y31_02995 n=1 Tax=Motilimonas cestriensis TaxID=2742685 RepID=A0ABS8W7P5_9GAMM|nr:DUF2057 family protein [Motilimonas cestriensis]MCE2593778.1 DUF2057 family protein [Motilimonas cestriensis]
MRIIKPLALAMALSMSAAAQADVTLTVPENVNLLVANGEKVELSSGLFSSNNTLVLPNGENQIVFRYEAAFNKAGEEISAVSDTIIAKFTASDSQASFVLPDYKSYRSAEKNISNLKWQLVDQSGNTIAKVEDKLTKEGMQLGRDYVDEAKDYNQAGGKAAIVLAGGAGASTAIALQKTATTNAQSSAGANTAKQVDSGTAEEMLHFWYNRADKATQQRFKDFINQ